MKNGPSDDPHSKAFGDALQAVREAIQAVIDEEPATGLSAAWYTLVDTVVDPDALALVPQNQQKLVSQGRQILLQIKFSVAQVIAQR